MHWKIEHTEGSGVWVVTDLKRSFYCYRESDAKWLLKLLNALQ